MGEAGANAELESLGIHEGKHEDLACFRMGGDAWDAAFFIELGSEFVTFLDLFNGGAGGKWNLGRSVICHERSRKLMGEGIIRVFYFVQRI